MPNPDAEFNPIWVFFFIIFIIVGSFFFLNLFVGVVISTFNQEHDKLGGIDLLTEKQKEWIELRLLVLRSAPQRRLKAPKHRVREFFFKVQENIVFERCIYISIILNTVVLFLKWYEELAFVQQLGEDLNYIFTAIFLTEAVIRIIAVSPKTYFKDGWNIFDFVIIIGSFVGIFVSSSSSLGIKGTITILRSFRILRLLRLIKRGKSLQLIFNTLVITFHSLANIGGLLLLFIFMYAILGMILFGTVMRNGIMNDYINFENFFNSFLTLFVVATGDSWCFVMQCFALQTTPAMQCIVSPTYQDMVAAGGTIGCGNPELATAYFLSYMFIVNLIFLKIFIAIILDGYNSTRIQDERLFNHDMNDRFKEVWTDFDPDVRLKRVIAII